MRAARIRQLSIALSVWSSEDPSPREARSWRIAGSPQVRACVRVNRAQFVVPGDPTAIYQQAAAVVFTPAYASDLQLSSHRPRTGAAYWPAGPLASDGLPGASRRIEDLYPR